MLKIDPTIINTYNSSLRTPQKKQTETLKTNFNYTQSPINLNHQPNAINVSFKGWALKSHLSDDVQKFVELVSAPETKKIAFLAHDTPDCDATGSMVAGKQIIEEATGKKADIFVMNPLHKNSKFIDKENEIIVINDLIEASDNSELCRKINDMFGAYDLVIVTDTPLRKLLDKVLDKTILRNAKKVVKIDHHPIGDNDLLQDYLFADLNIIDTAPESASQIIMQMVKPFGLNPEKINPKITDAITAGTLTDSGYLEYARGPEIYSDMAELAKTSKIREIKKQVSALTFEETQQLARIMSSLKCNKDKTIIYFVAENKLAGIPKNICTEALNRISNIDGVKYYFYMTKGQNGLISGSLRSLDKPINKIANELGGGGHPGASGFSAIESTTKKVTDFLLKKLTELENS